ncbi:Holliday junction resolvase RuvX [Ignatzschineria ureiclastica]|uniref:Putative pre-16S rRNA nuclease n=1 Tax=Ignatzschineria ureiclastica TaxID=472582 RepID=A0A2U2ADV4_9GAMM|nr:Holliday junction resolvase RuvX [Ignatzschineria ureiclastica]PWD80845.1 Holliday junction resolvase RuvX [Ignatzschineria ureiclastica]GGZ94388.1 putative pre-16S rRNA nuclease [Ignatzschineria ureiclastica]
MSDLHKLEHHLKIESDSKSQEPYIGNLKPNQTIERILGFDYGTKNLGIAVGNTTTNTAQPVEILPVKNNQPQWVMIEQLITDWQPDIFVVGIPYTQDGTETEHLKIIRKFIQRLHGRFGLPVFVVDESNSSLESLQYVKPSKKREKGQLDAIAAAIIIERWLNKTIYS